MKKVMDLWKDEIKRNIILLIISGVSLLGSIFINTKLPISLAWIAIVLCGLPIIKEAVIGLVTEFDIKADVLVSIALIASVIIGEIFAAAEIAVIMQLGSLLEELTVAKACSGIEKLVNITPVTARLLKNKTENVIAVEAVCVNDILRVLPGETIPVDGIIIEGTTAVDQAVITGESIPVDKIVGDEVKSGTMNCFGSFDMRATKIGEDSSLQRMVQLVKSADAKKAKIVGLADRWATWIVIVAVTVAVLTWWYTGEILRAVTILVVFCPCSLILATPTAVMAAIGNASRRGILVSRGDALERLAQVHKITFDKTGTLTEGKPEVVTVRSADNQYTEKEIFALAAAIESYSEHPLGKAIVSSYKKQYKEELDLSVKDFIMIPGRGVCAAVDEKNVVAGNVHLLEEKSIRTPEWMQAVTEDYENQGATFVYIAVNCKVVGCIALADQVRTNVHTILEKLRRMYVEPVMLTGDHVQAAKHIAGKIGISEMKYECLPEDKLEAIKQYQAENQKVCMVGDGVNDAPALKCANVGIAMGGIGSDIAIGAADITLVKDDIWELPHLFALAKHMMNTIKLNLTFSMLLNFIAIVLAITGILNPIAGALVHNSGSVLVIVNSALLLRWKNKDNNNYAGSISLS